MENATTESKRFDALDGVRATAMLLGVFYHLPISMYAGFGFGGFGGATSPKQPIDNWLHSFRMPLFFLISGFFANMILGKVGWKRYIGKRWWRIGVPLFVTLALLAGYRAANEYYRAKNPTPFGATPFGPPPGFGFGPPPNMGTPPANPFGPPPITGTNPAQTPAGGPGMFPFGGPPPTTGANGAPGFGPPRGAVPPMGNFVMPTFPSREWSKFFFGDFSRHLGLEHLWFLWYLLIFVTIGPLLAEVIKRLTNLLGAKFWDGLGLRLIQFNFLGLMLGCVSFPALLYARNFMGWSLANPHGFMGAFPDFFIQFYADQPFYLLYFLYGWWLFRLKDGLDKLSLYWLWNLSLGVIAFAVSQSLANTHSMRPEHAGWSWIRMTSFGLYGLGSAYSSLGFIGFFQRFLNRPSRVGRYLADTALWIYLIHLPLIPYLIWWVQPASGPWWAGSLAGMVIVTGVSLALYELVIRPTPLVYLYGPPRAKKSG